ncbi:MAG: AraC family transcriptional regulator [Chloroflexi bacterium]|nr:AraC family transcriptional regulator [Chloroflexota bacterium]
MRFSDLKILMGCPVKAQNAGLFISRGGVMHPTRVIESHELILVIQGQLDMWEEDQVFHLEAGQTLHLWPGRRHGSTVPMPPDLKFYWIHFEVRDVDSIDPHGTGEALSTINIPQVVSLPRSEGLERLFRIFLAEQEIGALHALSANLLAMLMLIEVGYQTREIHDTEGLNVVATWTHTYIRMNFDRPITASKVATALGYNVDYLGRIYHQTYGCTLTEAIHRRRIDKACDALLNSNLTICQIATNCGFVDPDYFRRIFKRYMQMTPTEYRDENARLHVITH